MLLANTLGWFDLAVYGFLAFTMAKVFFPAHDEAASVLFALATFGVTFIARPFGAIVIGQFADRRGRKRGLALTTALTMAGSGMIALAPSYDAAGIAAPIIVVTARLVQGFASGGEFGSAAAFLTEQYPERRAFYSSWQFAAQAVAAILATGFGLALNYALSAEQLQAWGWRIPFLFGLGMGPIAYALRSTLLEPPGFRAAPGKSAARAALTYGHRPLLISFGLIAFGTVANYTILFLPTYAAYELRLPASVGFVTGLAAALVQMVLTPVAGMLSDRWQPSHIAMAACTGGLLAAYPLLAWVTATPSLQSLLLLQVVLAVCAAMYGGSIAVVMAALFPPHMRSTGVALSYSLGVAAFGGFAPFINAWLIKISGSSLAPSWYLVFAAAMSIVALLAAGRLADHPAGAR
jgi:MHS family proline/betaine transporter-like MFS transporter